MLLSNLLVIAALALAKSALSGTPISACTPETVYVTVTPTSTSDNASTVISTRTVSEAHGTSSASTSSDGNYYFYESSGITVWLGPTPPASESFVQATTTIVVTPTDHVDPTTTSTLSALSTVKTTSTRTRTLTHSGTELTTTIHVTTISTTKTTDTITTTMTRPESSSERFPSDFSFDEPTTTIKSTSLTTDTYTTTMTRPKSSDDVTTLKSTSFTTVGSGTMTMTESADEETTTIFTTQFLTSIFTVPRPSSLTGIHSSGWDASAPVATGGNTTYTTTTILATLTTKLFMTTTTATRPSVTLSSGTAPYSNSTHSIMFVKRFMPTAPYPSNATSSGVIGSGTGMPMSTGTALRVSSTYMPSNGTANVTTTATSLRTVVVSSASTSATPLTSMCPEIGDFGKFTLKWDDVPGWSPEDNNTYTFPPVWNPYHHLIFANGYGYVPPPNEPFKPVSAPHMAIFLPNQTTTALEHPHAGILPPGGIGAGPRASQSAWWFDVYSSYFACDTATEPCTIQAIGYQYKPNIKEEYPRVMQNFSIPACPKNFTTECELKKVDFEPGFRALSSIQFQAFFEGNSSRQVFVMDDLALGWANNTCEAGLMRLRKK